MYVRINKRENDRWHEIDVQGEEANQQLHGSTHMPIRK